MNSQQAAVQAGFFPGGVPYYYIPPHAVPQMQQMMAMAAADGGPRRPKRPKSAYLCFASSNRQRIKSQYPDAGFGQVTKYLAQEWKSMGHMAKAPYNKMAEKDKQRYATEMEKWKTIFPMGDPRDAKKKNSKRNRDPSAPKRPKSAYFFFMDEVRPSLRRKNPSMRMSDLAKIMGNQWRDMSNKTKKKYEIQASKDKERYAHEMSTYIPQQPKRGAIIPLRAPMPPQYMAQQGFRGHMMGHHDQLM